MGIRFTLWYKFRILTVDALANQTLSDLHVLGFTEQDCIETAMQTIEPGQMIVGMDCMGSAADYVATFQTDTDLGLDWGDVDSEPLSDIEIKPFKRRDDLDFIDKPQQ